MHPLGWQGDVEVVLLGGTIQRRGLIELEMDDMAIEEKQIIVTACMGRVRGIDRHTGELLWEV